MKRLVLFRWVGGKSRILDFLYSHFPDPKRYGITAYCEPYVGAGTVAFHNPYFFDYDAILLNDLNSYIYNLYVVLHNPDLYAEFKQWVERMVAHERFYRECYEVFQIPMSIPSVIHACAFFYVQNFSMSGFDCTLKRQSYSYTTIRNLSIVSYSERLDWFHDRARRINFLNRDALKFIEIMDSPTTFFYVDPPYYPDSRVCKDLYRLETDVAHHEQLIELLLKLRGFCVLSGYENPLYEQLVAAGWEKHTFATYAMSRCAPSKEQTKRNERIEVIYVKNFPDDNRDWTPQPVQQTLFDEEEEEDEWDLTFLASIG